MQEDNDRRRVRVRIDQVHPQPLPLARRDLDPSPLARVATEPVNGVVGGAKNLHRFSSNSTVVGSVSEWATSSTVGSAMRA